MKATYKGETVRGFYVIVKSRRGACRYPCEGEPAYNGKQAIEVVDQLAERGLDVRAWTNNGDNDREGELITLDDMKRIILMPDGWQAKDHDEATKRLETQMEMAI